jgi:hypothetical protein
MAKSRVGGATADIENTASSISVAWPGGTAAGDFALFLVSWYENGSDGGLDVPTGFTSAGSSVVIAGATSVESRVDLWYRELNGSEAGSVSTSRVGTNFYAAALLDVYRGDGALTFVSATYGTPSTNSTATMPDVAGVNGQLQLGVVGIGDPATATNTADMVVGLSGTQDTNTGHTFYKFLTADIGAQSTTLSISRPYVGISILVNDAGGGGGGARKIILTRPA